MSCQLFVSRQSLAQPRAGLLLGILVLGDDNVDIEEASKSVAFPRFADTA